MRGARVARPGPLLALTTLALLLVGLLSPSASAQSPTAALESAAAQLPQAQAAIAQSAPGSGPVGDAIKKAATTTGDAIQGTTGTVGNTVGETGATVGKVIDETTGTEVGSTIADAAKDGGTTVKDTGNSAGRIVKDTGNTVGDGVDEVLDDTPLGDGDGDPGPGEDEDGRGPDRDGSNGPEALQESNTAAPADEVGEEGAFSAPLSAAGLPTIQAASLAPAFTVDEALQRAIEAAKALAFPIALTLLVVGFMLIQNRIDKKDPKLALAAVDTADELLSFS